MKRRVGFVIEQALGHVAYGMGLKKALAARDDLEAVFLEVPYALDGFGRLPLVGKNWTVRGSARAFARVRDSHRQAAFDALFLHTQTVSLFAGGHMRRIPTLLSLDATPRGLDQLGSSYSHQVGSRPVENLKLFAHKSVMRNAAWFTTWSEWTKKSLVDEYGASADKVTVIHPGTVLTNYPHPSDRQVRRDRPLQVLFVGGDFPRKGGDLLLDVFRRRLRGRCELHLVTATDVTPEEGVHVYHGLKPHSSELLERYRDADVFALPTRGDCLAVVLGEAMASCLPIITTSVGAHGEAVEDGKSGYVLKVDDGEALADRLTRLADDRELTHRMGMRSRQIGEERFDMQRNADRIAEILVRISKGKAAAAT